MRARVFKRGGARARKVSYSYELKASEVRQVIMAVRDAKAIGLPFNRFLTIHWERAGVTGQAAARATGSFLKLARDNLATKRQPFAYVWVRENDDGDGSKGDHVHILCHIPPGHSIGRRQRGWIRSITDQPYRKGVILTRIIAGGVRAAENQPEAYSLNLSMVGDYVLKGVGRETAAAHCLPHHGRGGRVIGQRIGRSKNLSRAVQRRSVIN